MTVNCMESCYNKLSRARAGPIPDSAFTTPFKRILDFLLYHLVLNFGHCDLPFDWAQGGELVEPFDICDL